MLITVAASILEVAKCLSIRVAFEQPQVVCKDVHRLEVSFDFFKEIEQISYFSFSFTESYS